MLIAQVSTDPVPTPACLSSHRLLAVERLLVAQMIQADLVAMLDKLLRKNLFILILFPLSKLLLKSLSLQVEPLCNRVKNIKKISRTSRRFVGGGHVLKDLPWLNESQVRGCTFLNFENGIQECWSVGRVALHIFFTKFFHWTPNTEPFEVKRHCQLLVSQTLAFEHK